MTSSDVPFWGPDFAALNRQDPEIAAVLLCELDRQREGLQLIASENFTSPAVLAVLGSTLSGRRHSLVLITPTCNHTRVPAPTSQRMRRSWFPATPFLRCLCRTVVTSRMAQR